MLGPWSLGSERREEKVPCFDGFLDSCSQYYCPEIFRICSLLSPSLLFSSLFISDLIIPSSPTLVRIKQL